MRKAVTIAFLTNVIPLDFLQVPFIAAVGALFYAESLMGKCSDGGLPASRIVWSLRVEARRSRVHRNK